MSPLVHIEVFVVLRAKHTFIIEQESGFWDLYSLQISSKRYVVACANLIRTLQISPEQLAGRKSMEPKNSLEILAVMVHKLDRKSFDLNLPAFLEHEV